MQRIRVTNIFDSMRPILVTAKLILFFFETIDGEKRNTRRTLLDQFLFVVTILMDLYLIPIAIRGSSGFLGITDSILINVGFYGAIVMCYVFCLLLPWVIRIESQSIFELMDSLAQFDINMLNIGYSIDHQRWFLYSVLYMCGGTSIVIVVLSTAFIFRSDNPWLDMSPMFPNNMTIVAFARASVALNVFGCTFALTLLFLKTRFSLLNNVLISTMECNPQHFRTDKQGKLIRKLASMYDLLNDTTVLFNQCFSKPGMFIFGGAFVYTLFTIFGLIHAYAGNTDTSTLRVMLANTMYCVFCIGYIIQMVITTSLLHDECKKTSSLVHKLISRWPHRVSFQIELRYFSQQLLHHIPKISCNMFDFDWTLFYTLCGSLTTYLVILLQFDFANINLTKLAQKPNLPDNVLFELKPSK